jgi:Integrase zinc binding domain/RNase H-like domain found in reverse transcriptase/Integrase core domain
LGVKNQNLSTYEKEFLAVLTVVHKWRYYLQGQPFVIKTNHISLKYLMEQRLTHTLQHKGLCKMLGLDYEVQYKKGVENLAADALSRRGGHVASGNLAAVNEILSTWIEELKNSYQGDTWVDSILACNHKGESLLEGITVHEGVIRKDRRIYVDSTSNWRTKMIESLHNSSVGGHSGIVGTYHRVKRHFYWPKLKETVLEHVKHCDVCQLNKGENVLNPGLLEPIPVPDNVWEVITMEFVMGLPRSGGKGTLLVVIDKFTKYYHLITLAHPFKASDVAQLFLDSIYRLHGLLMKIITDRDPVFTSVFWKEIMGKLGIKLNFSTAYHPQTDGQSERLNQCIENYLRCMVFQTPKTWAKWIPLAE